MFTLLNKAKWLLSGNILFAFSQWLMLILFSHFTNPDKLGYYSYALALTAPVFMLTNLQLRPLLVADLNTKNKFQFNQYFLLRSITIVLAIAICLVFLFFKQYEIFGLYIIAIVILMKASEAWSDIIYAYYNANKKTTFISQSLIIKSTSIIILSSLILWWLHSILYTLIAVFISYVLIMIFVDFAKIKTEFKQNNKKPIKDLIELSKMGLPLGIAVMLISLQTNIPRYFLEHSYSVKELGIYTIFYYFIVIGGIIINSICQYLSPYYSEYYRDIEILKLKKITKKTFCIALILGLFGLALSYLMGDFVIGLFYGKQYIAYSTLLPLIMVAGIFTYLSVVSGYLLTSLKVLRIQAPLFLSLAILTFIYSYIFIPKFGLFGAAYTTILSAMSQFLISTVIVYKRIQELQVND